MSSNNQLLKRALAVWSDGLESGSTVARILANQTGVAIPDSLPSWGNRISLFKNAVSHQRAQLVQYTLQPELRHLFLALDTLALSDYELSDLLGFHYLLRLDADTLSTLLGESMNHVNDKLQKGRQWVKDFDVASVHAR